MDTQGAYDFLRLGVPLLEEAGFGVLVPAWWGQPGGQLGARLALQTGGVMGTAGLCPINGNWPSGTKTFPGKTSAGWPRSSCRSCRCRDSGWSSRPTRCRRPHGVPGQTTAWPAGNDADPGACAWDRALIPRRWACPSPMFAAKGWAGRVAWPSEHGAPAKLDLTETPAGFVGNPAALPATAAWAWLTFLGRIRPGRLPGRRHGAGQNGGVVGLTGFRASGYSAGTDTAGLPDVGGGQLATGGDPLCAEPGGAHPPWQRPAGHRLRSCQNLRLAAAFPAGKNVLEHFLASGSEAIVSICVLRMLACW